MSPSFVKVAYNAELQSGTFSVSDDFESGAWERIKQTALSLTDDYSLVQNSVSVPWPTSLSILRQLYKYQKKWNFRFKPEDAAKAEIAKFQKQYRSVRASIKGDAERLTEQEIQKRLMSLGFTKRTLRSFQLRDLHRLLSLLNGANFSVPGAGKTTVTFALHLLTADKDRHMLVVGPKSCFQAWADVIEDCIDGDAPGWVKEPFTVLGGGSDAVSKALRSGAKRFVVNYEQLISSREALSQYLSQNPVHVVLDESHRMKGGYAVKRGSILLHLANLPVRRDILSGTPMPQGPSDVEAQIDFLWPGTGLGRKIAAGASPRSIIGNLYVRTTKTDLGLPPVKRHFVPVSMGKGQAALYAIVKSETLKELSSLRAGTGVDVARARRSVMRLLQLSTNPVLALNSMMSGIPQLESGVVQQVIDDGPSPKMIAVRDLARSLASESRKTVIWSIFTDTIQQMERMLADLNPVSVYGAIPSGDKADPDTREGRIKRFHEDPTCMVFIANPAAAGEGISLHHAAHDAIYVDRSYNATHYLQSIDRIHRLGLPSDIVTNIHIFQTKAPAGLGCVDHSVSRRLAQKVRALQQLLDDEDLHRIAFDEESSEEPIDYDIGHEDLIDLIDALEGKISWSEDEGV